jgi:VCBS repeat-containing protein
MGTIMSLFRKNHKILKYAAALILVFPGLCLFGKPRIVLAHIVADGSQTLPASINRDGGIPFLMTRMATVLAAITPDTAHTNEDTPININVLSNDGGPTTINSLITSGTLGSVSVNSDQTIRYDPTIGLNDLPAGQVYTDTFQYTVISGTLQTTTVDVGVTGVNDNPSAGNDLESTGENTPADFTDLLTNDSDPDTGDKALLTIQSVNTSGGTKGTVTINTGGKSVHYNPGTAFDSLGQGQTAQDTFGYT